MTTKRFGSKCSEEPHRRASEMFTNILSTWFTREIIFWYFYIFLKIHLKPQSLHHFNSNDRQIRLNLNTKLSVIVIRKVCPFVILHSFCNHISVKHYMFYLVIHSLKRMMWYLHVKYHRYWSGWMVWITM